MKKWEKEILEKQIKDEKAAISRLKKTYQYSLTEVEEKIQILMSKEQTKSVLNQVKYQENLRNQLKETYDKLYYGWYSTTDEYLKECYEESFYATMYGLHKQGVPLILPMNQAEAIQMAAQASDKTKLSKKMYSHVENLARINREEITKGILTGSSYSDIARKLEKRGGITFDKAIRIVRTESHRVHEEVQFKTLKKAQDKGADIVKQWDASLDSRTRETHKELDGQLRELEQPFKTSSGATTMYPGGFGIASEDINCRCVVLQRARWALDKSESEKYLNNISNMTDADIQSLADKLGVSKNDLLNSQNNLIKADNYNEFKKKYKKKAEQLELKEAAQKELKGQPIETRFPFRDNAYQQRKKFAWENRYTDKYKADTYYRAELDKNWNNYSDSEKFALWKYTENSNPLNKPLSGYANGEWSRSSFVGIGKAKWGTEDSWRSVNSTYFIKNFAKDSSGHIDHKKVITDLTNMIDKSVFNKDVFLVRGSDERGLAGLLESEISFDDTLEYIKKGDVKSLKQLFEGKTVTNHSFTSTGVASGTGLGGNIEYRIYAPKGTKGVYAEPQSYYGNTISGEELYKAGKSSSSVGNEAEVILQRGTSFKVTSISKSNTNKYTIEMEVVDQPDYFKFGDEETFNNGLSRHKD